MASEEYIELPPSPPMDNERGDGQGEALISQEVNKEGEALISQEVNKEGEALISQEVNKEGEALMLQEVSKEGEALILQEVNKEGEALISQEVNKEGEALISQEVNKEDVNESGRDEDMDLHEDGSKDNLKMEEADRDGNKGSYNILKDDSQDGGNKMQQGLNFHHNSLSMSEVDDYEVVQMKSVLVEENGNTFVEESEKMKIDITSKSGVKRARISYTDDQPYVQVIYNYLPRESKKKLSELLQNWSEWHAQYVANAKNSTEESLERGDEIYFPALQVGGANTSLMTFWMDKPVKQNLKEGTRDHLPKEKEEDVPYYDRACAMPLSIQNGLTISECSEELPAEASRCFNCGSYSHSLKDCLKPRDNTAISNARNQHKAKKAQASGPRCPQRYYHNSPRGKFEGIKPGMLGSETRQSLGIGELDPPPWLNRMRELGYPPAYLDSDEPDEPSGIVIHADDDDMELEEGEEGELIEIEHSKSSGEKKMTVQFPGINAPIPENADERLWGSSFLRSDDRKRGQKSDAGHAHSSPSSLSTRGRGGHFDQLRPRDYTSLPDEPPGTERAGKNASSSDYMFRGRWGDATPSPNYSSESQQSKMRYPFPQSPSLSRSVSDNGHRTPSVQDGSPRGVHVQGTSPRYGEHGSSPYGQYSPHSPIQYSSPSPGRYSSQIYSPGSTDHALPERRHGRSDSYAAHDGKHKKERSESSRYHRR